MITNEVINHAIDYILQNINEDLSVDDVAAYCHFSKYYFSRMFKKETGESVYAFIKRIKLEQSAFRLKAEPGRSITDIGCDFESFQKSIQHPFFHHTHSRMGTFEECNRKISIKTLPDCFVLYERSIGSYRYLSQKWQLFIRKYQDYISMPSRHFTLHPLEKLLSLLQFPCQEDLPCC